MPGTGTGLIIIDMIIRPFLKFGMKFPLVGFSVLFLIYGFIAYHALKSAFVADRL
jgi:hypothetical protein